MGFGRRGFSDQVKKFYKILSQSILVRVGIRMGSILSNRLDPIRIRIQQNTWIRFRIQLIRIRNTAGDFKGKKQTIPHGSGLKTWQSLRRFLFQMSVIMKAASLNKATMLAKSTMLRKIQTCSSNLIVEREGGYNIKSEIIRYIVVFF